MKTPDLYETLGVPREAKARDIKAAYRKRAAAAHPDKGGSDAEAQAINEAWETLGDPARRARYDATGEVEGTKSTLSPGEELFVQILDQQLSAVLSEGRGNLLAKVERELKKLERHQAGTIEMIRERIALVAAQLGRFVLVGGPESEGSGQTENLIESKLKRAAEGLRISEVEGGVRLVATKAALSICKGYRDTEHEEKTDGAAWGFQALSWDDYKRMGQKIKYT